MRVQHVNRKLARSLSVSERENGGRSGTYFGGGRENVHMRLKPGAEHFDLGGGRIVPLSPPVGASCGSSVSNSYHTDEFVLIDA